MLTGLAAECTATYSLSKYEDLQTHIETWFSTRPNPTQPNGVGAHLYQNDLIDVQIVTIVFCVLTACIFGADFFFLAMFPRQVYPRWYDIARRGSAVIVSLGMLAAALGSTIVVASHSAVVSGVSQAEAVAVYAHPPFRYATWAVNIAYVVLLWVATVGVIISTVCMFLAIAHEHRHGHPDATPLSDEKTSHVADAKAETEVSPV
ncbi:hypothetical protein CPB85DRAFT_1214942 [Mucidula mucida]|nr:hypothetical protein CPB85DRAFT_1214942 [Mucidula mucida]